MRDLTYNPTSGVKDFAQPEKSVGDIPLINVVCQIHGEMD